MIIIIIYIINIEWERNLKKYFILDFVDLHLYLVYQIDGFRGGSPPLQGTSLDDEPC